MQAVQLMHSGVSIVLPLMPSSGVKKENVSGNSRAENARMLLQIFRIIILAFF